MKLALGDYMKIAIKLLGEVLPPLIGFSPNLNSPYIVEATSKMKVDEVFLVRWRIQAV